MTEEKFSPAHASEWFRGREWTSGLQLSPHKSTNVLEFYFHFFHNPQRWQKAFEFLNNTNLDNIQPGRYKIDNDDVYAIVAEGETKNAEDTKWEAHLKYIDIQYVVSGKEKIGVGPLSKANSIELFNEDKDIGFYELPEADGKYYNAEPGTFFIFFPRDLHRPSIRTTGADKDKKIVIKIKI